MTEPTPPADTPAVELDEVIPAALADDPIPILQDVVLGDEDVQTKQIAKPPVEQPRALEAMVEAAVEKRLLQIADQLEQQLPDIPEDKLALLLISALRNTPPPADTAASEQE